MVKSKDYTAILLEDMNSKFELLLETVKPMKQLMQDTFVLKQDMQEVKADIRVIKAAVADTSKQVNALETRATKLEAA